MTTLHIDLGATLIKPALAMAKLNHPGLPALLEAIAQAENQRAAPGRYGPFGMTDHMHQRVWDRYIVRSPDLACHIRGLASQREFLVDPHRELDMNWGYATALAGLNCLYYSTDGIPIGLRPRFAVDLWRRGWHRGHKVNKEAFLQAYRLCYAQSKLLAA